MTPDFIAFIGMVTILVTKARGSYQGIWLGFNTLGLWNRSRHPNYLGEQGFWLSLYLVVIWSGCVSYYFFSYTLIGPLLLVLIFLGSSSLQESISSKKYPEYSNYISKVSKYIPFKKYR